MLMDEEKETAINPNDIDMISNLPDFILTDILSRLNADEVIQTCILSKRWQKLWAFVPCLDFTYHNETQQNFERFEDFVSPFLRFRDDATNLQTFSVRPFMYVPCYNYKPPPKPEIPGSVVRRWILYALKHNCKKLKVDTNVHDLVHLPECVFTSDLLEEVDLNSFAGGDREKIKPDVVCLPRLRKLSLRQIEIKEDYMKKLLLGCPALENLCLSGCNLKISNISFQSLKFLSFGVCNFESESIPPNISISAPALDSLFISVRLDEHIKLKDMSKVSWATISSKFVSHENGPATNYDFEFLNSLSGVNNLDLLIDRPFMKDMLTHELPKCATFVNLKNLSLGDDCMYCNFDLVCSFLKRCPNLELLRLYHRDEECQDKHIQEGLDQYLKRIEIFNCDRVKEITINYTGNDHDVALLVQLLQSIVEIQQDRIICRKA